MSQTLSVRGLSVPALVATALLRHDLPDATDEEREAAARYVEDCVDAMPDFTRFGVRVSGAAVVATLSALGRRPYRSLSEDDRSRLAARLMSTSLPILGEFGRLTRGLGLVGVLESRHAVPAGHPAEQGPAA